MRIRRLAEENATLEGADALRTQYHASSEADAFADGLFRKTGVLTLVQGFQRTLDGAAGPLFLRCIARVAMLRDGAAGRERGNFAFRTWCRV
jgi:hypothetical protein